MNKQKILYIVQNKTEDETEVFTESKYKQWLGNYKLDDDELCPDEGYVILKVSVLDERKLVMSFADMVTKTF